MESKGKGNYIYLRMNESLLSAVRFPFEIV